MREAFIQTLLTLAQERRDIFLVTGDMGFSVLEPFRDRIPERFINAGVAEQNMIGVAAGLALTGKQVFVYSIIPFACMRCFEQIRNDLCMPKLNVKIVGIGTGYHYGPAGTTHHAIEDVALMRALPGMKVIDPSTPQEAQEALKAVADEAGPVYIRLGKYQGDSVFNHANKFVIGQANILEEGEDLAVISSGSVVYNVHKALQILRGQGLRGRLIHMPTIKPIDEEMIRQTAKKTEVIFTVEENNIIGALGSAVAEVLAEGRCNVHFRRLGIGDVYEKAIGSQTFLQGKHGLTPETLAKRIQEELASIIL
ncbi:MAG: hypothetical protein A2787_10100 [Omnitrophica WOR_2 bacterium RIFCSPHIGHO2_01_FULL_48_9]|nr:MAG: hypothetical protein A2787_10100 [Omnitrophica WOR_2 bacterium RIFCSPHIGHO2_01_FULL_48_9]